MRSHKYCLNKFVQAHSYAGKEVSLDSASSVKLSHTLCGKSWDSPSQAFVTKRDLLWTKHSKLQNWCQNNATVYMDVTCVMLDKVNWQEGRIFFHSYVHLQIKQLWLDQVSQICGIRAVFTEPELMTLFSSPPLWLVLSCDGVLVGILSVSVSIMPLWPLYCHMIMLQNI